MREAGVASLLHQVVQGDETAWKELVDRFSPMLWGTARRAGLNVADADDVVQTTWLLLAENVDRMRDPAALPGWLATTARRESLRLAKARSREAPSGIAEVVLDVPDHREGPEARALRSHAEGRMRHALSKLSQRCQELLSIIALAPETSYAQVAQALGMARGTVGPKKSRCLAALRTALAAADLPEEAAG